MTIAWIGLIGAIMLVLGLVIGMIVTACMPIESRIADVISHICVVMSILGFMMFATCGLYAILT